MKRSLAKIGDLMKLRHESLAVAESATSGTLQNMFSRTEKATEYYQGGVTTYNLEQKIQLLGVNFDEAIKCNCVSETIAAQMAKGVTELFKTDWGIGFTGYASPVSQLDIDRIFGYYAICYKNEIVSQGILYSKEKYMKGAQTDYAEQIFENFFAFISK